MRFPLLLTLQALWLTVCQATQHYPTTWGHYDLCKSHGYTDEGPTWYYMACQPEAADMTKYLKVTLDPPNITCGDPPETYCTLENPYMCNNECDAATDELAHPPELMFDFEGRNPTTFWQSTSWKKYPKPLAVNITLSWNKTIELTDDIVITFESGRPEQMVLEKSLDYGRSWQPYQFYATDCLDAFTMEPKTVRDITQHTLLDIICTEEYSRGYVWKNDKTVRFEIKDRFALFAGPKLHNMASLYGQLDTTKNLRDFFTITDLRVRLLRPATGATMVDENNLSRYFYAISDIKVHGRCKCNLHANSCIFDKEKLTCECEHNTTGPDCGRCKRNYQARAWSAGSYLPIPKGTANICLPNSVGPVIRQNISSLGVANRNQAPQVALSTVPSVQVANSKRARVCDNELLRCQNGGVCVNNIRCQCPPAYTGLLCEKPRCENEPGGCGLPDSGQGSLRPPSPILLLLLFVLGLVLLMEICWVTVL
ncbi:netrin-G1 isoform X5 [Ctenopharyngodon idella]|uniref:netrin-G1 isoform X5 n=1 Tax=Ctenopharyngodon idella TaxID=7959 RepID=UPI00223030FB|nr:netrin-G1 isoform X5 [Ctenopharyngodon idella]